MSLINEALKKAQKQRALDVTAPPAVTTGPLPPRVPKRAAPMPAQRLVLAGMVCVIFLLAAAGGAWFLFTEPAPAPAPAPAPRVAKAPDATPAVPPSTPPAATATTVASVPSTPSSAAGAVATSPTGPAAPAATPAAVTPPTPVTGAPAPAPVPAVAASPAPSPEPALRPEPTVPGDILRIDLTSARPFAPPDPKIAAAVDTMKVSGIRASGSDPKVLMNDRVFRRNDLVDRALGLRLQDIAPDRLTFVDETGATYVKNF